MPDLDYAKITGRFALTVGDGPDGDDDPDVIYCDGGTVLIEPLVTYTKVAGGSPVPFTAGHSVISASIDANGYLTFNGKQYVYVVDLTSDKINPTVGPNKATHKITFVGVTADGTDVNFETVTVRVSKDGADGDGVNDLTIVSPVSAAPAQPIYRGETGAKVESASIDAGDLVLELSDGTEINAGALPVGPGGSDDGVASYIASPASATQAAIAETIAGRVIDPTDVGYDGIAILSQSNGVSQGTGIDAMLDVTSERIGQFPGSGPYVGQVIAATDPLYHREQRANTVGFGIAFARKYLRTIKLNRAACLIPAGMSSVGFTTSSQNPPPAGYTLQAGGGWDVTGAQGGILLYQLAVAQITAFLALDPKNRVTALLWCQGEADTAALTQSQYAAKFDALVAGIRGLSGVDDDLPVVVVSMIPERIASNAQVQAVDAAHIQTQSRLVRAAYVYGPTGMNMGDNLHYNAAGQRVIGNDLLLPALLRARANVLGVAPVAPPSVSLSQVGTTVTAAIERPVCRFTDFETQYRRNGGAWVPVASPVAKPTDVFRVITGLTPGDDLDVQVRTVNEQGASAWRTVSFAVASPANAPTVGAVVPSISGATVPFTPAATGSPATSFRTDYRLVGAGAWTAGTVTTASPGTIVGLAHSSNYETRVVPINPAGDGTPSTATPFTTGTPTAFVADVGVAADYAWSWARRLVTAYAGNALKVRRSSDNALMDVGFTGGGAVNTTAMLAWSGADSVFVHTVYDQSGNARDLVMTTAAAQPMIVNAGVLVVKNGQPSAHLDGVDDLWDYASVGIYAAGAATLFTVAAFDSDTVVVDAILSEGHTVSANSARYCPGNLITGGVVGGSIIGDSNTPVVTLAGGSGDLRTGVLKQVSIKDTGAAHAVWVNKGVHKASTAYARSGVLTMTVTTVGAIRGRGFPAGEAFLKGNLSELVVYKSALSDAARVAGETNQIAYYAIA